MIKVYPIDKQQNARQFLVPLAGLNHPDSKIKELLKLNLNMLRKQNDSAEGVELNRQQGACQWLTEFIEQISSASEIMERMGQGSRRNESDGF